MQGGDIVEPEREDEERGNEEGEEQGDGEEAMDQDGLDDENMGEVRSEMTAPRESVNEGGDLDNDVDADGTEAGRENGEGEKSMDGEEVKGEGAKEEIGSEMEVEVKKDGRVGYREEVDGPAKESDGDQMIVQEGLTLTEGESGLCAEEGGGEGEAEEEEIGSLEKDQALGVSDVEVEGRSSDDGAEGSYVVVDDAVNADEEEEVEEDGEMEQGIADGGDYEGT